jgi:hypothetical protein
MKIAFVSKIYFSIYQSYITPEMYFCGKIKMIEELFPVEQYFMILLKSIHPVVGVSTLTFITYIYY